jgi:hypothetical protein
MTRNITRGTLRDLVHQVREEARRTMRVCFGTIVVLSVPGLASAQVLQPPPRPSEQAPDRNRTRQELTLQGSVLGGYDDNLSFPSSGGVLGPRPSGYIGFGDSTLRYWVGKDARSMEVSARAYMNRTEDVAVGPSYGGEQRLRVRTTLGRRTQVEATQELRYAPYFSLGFFGGTQGSVGAEDLDRNPTNALTESGSWTSDASVSLSRQWTRATKMDLGLLFSKQTYVGGGGFDSQIHGGSIGFERSITRSAGIRVAYHRSDSGFIQQNGSGLPNLTNHRAELGLQYQRRLSRSRQISFAGGAGALYVDSVDVTSREPLEYWAPSGYGNLSLTVGRSWSVGADYRRSTTVLQGTAPHVFVNDVGTISAGGWLQPWLETVFTAGYSNGVSGERTSDRAPGSPRNYGAYAGTVQLRFQLSRWWSSVVSVKRFQYRLNPEMSHSLGVTSQMHGNAVRVGFAWALPLNGSSVERAEPRNGRKN